MKRTLLLVFVLLLPGVVGARPVADAPTELRSLVEAELAFAAAAAKDGMREAFLAHLAEGSVIFRPGPVDGREWMESWQGTQGRLAWTPVHAEVALDGAFGFTTGPWEYRASATSESPAQTGYYLSVWRRDEAGWQVLSDIGTVGPIPDSLAAGEITWPNKAGATPELPADLDPEAELERLMQRDAALSGAVFENGLDRFFDAATEDVLILRLQDPVLAGREAAREAMKVMLVYPAWEPMGGAVAASGDMGLTYGRIYSSERALGKAAEVEGSYLRVWRRDAAGQWLVAADVIIPNARG